MLQKKLRFTLPLQLLLLAIALPTCSKSHSSQRAPNYGSTHFQKARYLFKKSFLYVKKGNFFYKTNHKLTRGRYVTTHRLTHPRRDNFLYLPSRRGWIKEVYTSAASRIPFIKGSSMEIGKERVDKWYSVPANYIPHDLVKLPDRYCKFRRIRLRRAAAEAFMRLVESARRSGVYIYGFSGYRAFATQRFLFLRRIRIGRGIKQKAVAKPGHSEHQLGTTVDVTGSDTSLAAKHSFKYTRAAKWLRRFCYDFGFVLSYSEENKIPTGYIFESWHIRYIGKKNIAAWKKIHLGSSR